MKTAPLQERRNRQILADIVRTYIETGEPVSSRAISKSFEEILSTATIRNIMADLEDSGFLYQPHTSAGPVLSPGGKTRDKILQPTRSFTQPELDATADFLNRHYSGWTLEAIRTDLLQKLAAERERYEGIAQNALTLCDPGVLGDESAAQMHVE